MKVGCVREIKSGETRVGLTPDGAREYIGHGHKVIVEAGAGEDAGFADEAYEDAGAAISQTGADVWAASDMIVKVKEPVAEEYYLMREGQILYAFLHLAAQKMLAYRMLRSKCVGVACETLTDGAGNLPVLAPMSAIAGAVAVLEGARLMLMPQGPGLLACGSPGVKRADVCVLGGGVAGGAAARTAVGLGARVTVLDINPARLAALDAQYGARIDTAYASPAAVERYVCGADLVVGAVLVPGATAPRIIPRHWLANMRPGSVLADIAVDQGGCAESTRPTTHGEPTYLADGVLHYCVANIPAAAPRTSAPAFCNAALPFGLTIADMGLEAAVRSHPGIASAINIYRGKCTYGAVAEALEAEYADLKSLL